MRTENINYGPLEALIGKWQGDKGTDLSPEPDDTEQNTYTETIEFFPEGSVSNAEEQWLAILRYHQHVNRIRDNKDIHDQVGYWTWDEASGIITHTFAIPRGIAVVAGGSSSQQASEGKIEMSVRAEADNTDWSIIEAPFLQKKARTLSFEQTMIFNQTELAYQQTSVLDIYGRTFNHTDENTLSKV